MFLILLTEKKAQKAERSDLESNQAENAKVTKNIKNTQNLRILRKQGYKDTRTVWQLGECGAGVHIQGMIVCNKQQVSETKRE